MANNNEQQNSDIRLLSADQLLVQIKAVKSLIAPNATDEELILFASFSKKSGLDPIAKQIHFVKRGDKVTFQTAIDGYRLIAERGEKYQGQTEAEFGPMIEIEFTKNEYTYNPSGRKDKKTVKVKKLVPEWCRVGVFKAGFKEPLYVTAWFEEYLPEYPNQHMWMKMPRVMLSKVAEALALRKAFPNELGGIYTEEEMQQANNADNDNKKNKDNNSNPKPKATLMPAKTWKDLEAANSPEQFKEVLDKYKLTKENIEKLQPVDRSTLKEIIKSKEAEFKNNSEVEDAEFSEEKPNPEPLKNTKEVTPLPKESEAKTDTTASKKEAQLKFNETREFITMANLINRAEGIDGITKIEKEYRLSVENSKTLNDIHRKKLIEMLDVKKTVLLNEMTTVKKRKVESETT